MTDPTPPAAPRTPPLEVGDHVKKTRGYIFPGEVRAVFTTKAGAVRYVVENSLCPGLLHIFNGEQIEARYPKEVPHA